MTLRQGFWTSLAVEDGVVGPVAVPGVPGVGATVVSARVWVGDTTGGGEQEGGVVVKVGVELKELKKAFQWG